MGADLTMGNKSTRPSPKAKSRTWYYQRDERSHLQVYSSEDEYIPMPTSMKRSLLESKKFRRNFEHRDRVSGSNTDNGIQRESLKDNERNEKSIRITLVEQEMDENETNSVPEEIEREFKIEVLESDMHEINKLRNNEEEGDSTRWVNVNAESDRSRKQLKSEIDLVTGKSRFTLELEDKLRQSKLKLGFDADYSGWKEFSYTESPRRPESPQKHGPRENKEMFFQSCVCPRRPVQICAHSCQVLNLCRQSCVAIEPSEFKDEMSRKYDVHHLASQQRKGRDCECDLCTLAYLTDMGPPSLVTSPPSPPTTQQQHRYLEKVEIKDCNDDLRARMHSEQSYSSSSSRESSGDCTNRMIRRRFRRATGRVAAGHEVYNSTAPHSSHSSGLHSSPAIEVLSPPSRAKATQTSKEHRPQTSRSGRSPCDLLPQPPHPTGTSASDSRWIHSIPHHRKKSSIFAKKLYQERPSLESSSSFLTQSISSLSTILSYHHVRQIFQSFLVRKRSRKRKRNITEFRHMEKLGLGEVRNGRWYPSESKTFEIWSSMQGIHAEFRKLPKSVIKPHK